ncbi:DUF2846 domain-containing protein [Pseudoduganella chitinolytica]|uniref:DUF2846 domain-containing protein n=1 Tax=Pseudoduganella chitinolytica TaxID=34070 RepID=A0ABY8B5Q4_9BURK|nr:DUF2846 domain-containing protein [Pseudoduganella chitinolytica]WEF31277.1 DUF2846 domain-containing protein [Pseudoduganella chitinolytica]
MKIIKLGAIALLAALTGCAATGPKFADQQVSTPKLTAEQGRVYFYRVNSFVGGALRPDIKLDGAAVGQSKPGGYFYVDAAPGAHEAQTSTEATNKLTFVLDKGETKYVRTSVSMGVLVGHVKPELVGQEEALKELSELSYIGAPAK